MIKGYSHDGEVVLEITGKITDVLTDLTLLCLTVLTDISKNTKNNLELLKLTVTTAILENDVEGE